MKKSPLGLPALVESFLCDRLQNQRNLSGNTIASYRDTFLLLLSFVKAQTKRSATKQQLQDWDAPVIEKFLTHLERGRKNSVRTRNNRLAAIRSFMNYVGQKTPVNLGLASRVVAIPSKRFERPLLGHFTHQEIQELLRVPTSKRLCDRRNHLLWLLLYHTGARISEILRLDRQDVQEGTPPRLIIHGKGRKTRAMSLQPGVWKHLQLWLKEIPAHNEAPLFVNRLGNRLSRFGAHKNLKAHLQTASQLMPSLKRKQISSHTFRHTTAMHLLESKVPIETIAMILGHESSVTTHQYVELDLRMKEKCLLKLAKPGQPKRYRPKDKLIQFLQSL